MTIDINKEEGGAAVIVRLHPDLAWPMLMTGGQVQSK